MEKEVSVEKVIDGTVNFINKKIDNNEYYDILEEYEKCDENYKKANEGYLIVEMRKIIQQVDSLYYFLMSFLLQVTMSRDIYKELLGRVLNDEILSKEEKFFLYNQFKVITFLNGDIKDEETEDITDKLYAQIYEDYILELGEGYSFIPCEERNKDFVIVMGTQVLEAEHGPTKTLFDRCFILDEYMNKKVFIINTAEFMSLYCTIPIYGMRVPLYSDNFLDIEGFEYQGKQFQYFQCPKDMPDIAVIKEIMEVVISEKPYFILTIGDSLVGDLCSKLVPVIEVSTVPSARIRTKSQFQVIGRKVTDDDREWMKKYGHEEDHIVEGLFTSAFVPQTHHFTREELGLPQNQFVILIVGGRLDDEIDNECLQLLYRLAQKGIFIAIMGKFSLYDKYIEENAYFKENSCFLGFQEDVLAVNECCDVYLNPRRTGGGTSCAEALSKGLPVVTLDYGDVGLGAGAEFHVSSYEEMYNKILRYSEDSDYYNVMRKKAFERAETLTDSKGEFIKIINKVEKSNRF